MSHASAVRIWEIKHHEPQSLIGENMKRSRFCSRVSAAVGCRYGDTAEEIPVTITHTLKVMFFNIQTNNSYAWSPRKDAVVAMIEDNATDMFGLQEARLDQLTMPNEKLTGYARVGIDSDNSPSTNEYIVYIT